MREAPRGFWKVTGFEPYVYSGVRIEEATFATKESAEKFAAEKGGVVQHRDADGIMIDGKIYPVRS